MRDFENIRNIALRPDVCECGKRHELRTDDIILYSGALNALPEVVKRHCPQGRVLVVCDGNTYKVAGSRVEKLLADSGIDFDTFKLKDGVAADEKAVESLTVNSAGAAFFIAVGSGTINDICRYTAFKTGRSFISVPTAASMDGYVSSVAAMIFGGFKMSLPALPPVAVVADTAIIATAPMELTAAGVGDILGKYICLCDWEIASLVSAESFCKVIASLEYTAASEVLELCGELAKGSIDAVESLTYALLLSGLAMQLNNDSRPASGAEHQLSHFWEMRFLRDDRAPALHGAKVGVATVAVADIYHNAAERFKDTPQKTVAFSLDATLAASVFGPAAGDIIKENTPDPNAAVDFDKLVENHGRIIEVIDRLPDAQVFKSALEALGAPTVPRDLGIEDDLTAEGLKYCIFVRRRLTLMRLIRLLG